MTRQPARFQRLWATLAAAYCAIAAAAASAEDATVLRGQVLSPDGKPAAAAEIYWLQLKPTGEQSPPELWWEKRAVTDYDGHFQWTLEETDARIGPANRPPLIAFKPGFGVDGLEIGRDDAAHELTLRLTENCPIRGRLTNTEGQPVKGAKIVVGSVESPTDDSLDRLLERWKRTPQLARGTPERVANLYQRFSPLIVETDSEGRFTISGVGSECMASLNITAAGYMSEVLRVVTRAGFDAEEYNKSFTANAGPFMRMPGQRPRFVGPAFDHVMEIELVIRGSVFTGPDRKPVAGAGVGGGTFQGRLPTTDAAGHFELRGLRRSQTAGLSVHPPGDLLSRHLQLEVAPGETVLDVEVELKEGIVVEGRVFDPATGMGVHAQILYLPLADNHFVDQPGYDGNISGGVTNDDGHFRRLVPPGPGVLMAQVRRARPQGDGNKPMPYRQASFNEEDSKRVPTTVGETGDRYFTVSANRQRPLNLHEAVKVIDAAPDSGPITCDLPLDRGNTATISIEDDQGQPLSDAWVAGVADTPPMTFKIAAPTCTIYGLGADRPRRIWVFHPERHLAASLTLTGEEPGPVTVRLGAPATIVGRALDPDGEPLADVVVDVSYLRRIASELQRFATMEKAPLKTDADGRFRVEDLLPGERLAIGFKQADAYFYIDGLTTKERQLAAGQKLELGDVKVKENR
jgi:hypothetical protein